MKIQKGKRSSRIQASRSSSSLSRWLNLRIVDPNPFACSRCPKRFPTCQALGGHQNAHRKERLEEVRLCLEEIRRERKMKSRPESEPERERRMTPTSFPNPLVAVPPFDSKLIIGHLEMTSTGVIAWVEPSPRPSDEPINVVMTATGLGYESCHGHHEVNQKFTDHPVFNNMERDFMGVSARRELHELFPFKAKEAEANPNVFHGGHSGSLRTKIAKRELDLTLKL